MIASLFGRPLVREGADVEPPPVDAVSSSSIGPGDDDRDTPGSRFCIGTGGFMLDDEAEGARNELTVEETDCLFVSPTVETPGANIEFRGSRDFV